MLLRCLMGARGVSRQEHISRAHLTNAAPPPHACAQSIYWEYPVIGGEAPCPRSGHTFTVVGERFIVFGGCGRVNGEAGHTHWAPIQRSVAHACTAIHSTGKAQAFNDLHELDTSDPDDYK